MKKFALKLGTLALALVLFLGLCPMSFSSIASMGGRFYRSSRRLYKNSRFYVVPEMD